MKYDFLVIGSGICGVLLSRALLRAGATVLVIDDTKGRSSTRNAGGIINPVTGKRLVTSWMIEELMPVSQETYRTMERELGVSFLKELDLLDFHPTEASSALFTEKMAQGNKYLYNDDAAQHWHSQFRYNYGIGRISPCMLLNTNVVIDIWHDTLRRSGNLMEEKLDYNQIRFLSSEIAYKHITAKKIIFCEGAAGAFNPWFCNLPWAKDKGEALIVSIEGLPDTHIYKQGISIVPWKDDLFWVGATHDWKYTDVLPSASFRNGVEEQLNYWLKLPFKIVDHLVALRPANIDRKPFIGIHPKNSMVGIFNGMGGKGFSMAPYFAEHFSDHLVDGTPLFPDVDIARNSRVLAR